MAASAEPATVSTSSAVAAASSTTSNSVGSEASAADSDNDHLFTSGDIDIPPGTNGELSVVLGQATDDGDLLLVVRNGREETVYGIAVAVTGRDDSGAQTFSTIVLIEDCCRAWRMDIW